jgi:L-fuconate dehydratase
VRLERGRYLAPRQPGSSAEMRRESLQLFGYPYGPVWNAGPAILQSQIQPRPVAGHDLEERS